MMINLADPLVQYYICALLMAPPMVRIFERAGFNGIWASLLAIPFIGWIVCAGYLTFNKWNRA